MDQYYKELHKQAVDLEHQFKDRLDNADYPAANSLRRDVKQYMEDIEANKNPRSLEDRAKNIQRQLREVRSVQGQTMMDTGDIDHLHQLYERQRDNIRRLPNY